VQHEHGPPGVPYTRIPVNRGYKYVSNNELYVQYRKTSGVLYLKCTVAGCKGTAAIPSGAGLLSTTRPHNGHHAQKVEIKKLVLLNNCRQRAAEDVGTPIRQIFEKEMRDTSLAATSITFANIESSMYKKRRSQLHSVLQQTVRPNVDEVSAAVTTNDVSAAVSTNVVSVALIADNVSAALNAIHLINTI